MKIVLRPRLRGLLAGAALWLAGGSAFAVSWPKRPRLAGQQARNVLRSQPGDLDAREQLGVALAAQGACSLAVVEIDKVLDVRPLGPPGVQAQAICAAMRGDMSGALAEWEELGVMEPADATVWLRTGRARLDIGDVAGAWAALGVLESLPGADIPVWLLRAELRFVTGDPAVEEDMQLAGKELGAVQDSVRVAVRVIEARWWMAQGYPRVAADRLKETKGLSLVHRSVARVRAEALRRAGERAQAAEILARPMLVRDEDLRLTSTRVRLAADTGELVQAAALLSGMPDVDVPDVVATRWYVAQARGQSAEAERLAARYEDLPGPRVPLALLLPPTP